MMAMKDQYYDEHLQELQGATEINRVLKERVNPILIRSFKILKDGELDESVVSSNEPNHDPKMMKSVLFSIFMLLKFRVKEQYEVGFSELLQIGAPARVDVDDKYRGRKLLSLNEHAKTNKRKCFWRWYLNTTGTGDNLFQKAANNLVLYTSVNKTTLFYRLLGTVRERRTNVHPRVKRMMTMLNFYIGIHVHRCLKKGFDQIKLGGKSKRAIALERIILASQRRKRCAIGMWNIEARRRRDELNKKRSLMV